MENAAAIEDAQNLIKKSLDCIVNKDFTPVNGFISKAYEISQKEDFAEGISVCLSLKAFLNYISKDNNYGTVLEDASYIAQRAENDSAKLINELVKGNISFCENSKDVALIHYNNALNIAVKNDKYNLKDDINTRIKQLQNGMDYSMPTQIDPLVSLVKISRSITALTDIDEVLKVIAEETKNAMHADRCTVFLWDKDTNELWSKVALGVESNEIRFPANKGLAGYVVQSGETVNITDAYADERFNPEVDNATGYHTKTILCMPIMNNNHETIGAFQVLNKIDGVFTKNDEDLLVAIGGSASIALENAQLFDKQLQMYHEQKLLFESFIDTLATSIDARDKITAGHSLRVKLYSSLICDALNLDSEDKALIEKAATLHDIGKIGIRDSVLQKDGKLTDEEYKHIQEHVRITHNILNKIYMSPKFRIITEIASSHHEKWDGSGYYRHLKGKEITLGGRILAVADVFDAITSKRHYRDRMPIKNVLSIINEGAGSHFDENIVKTFMSISLEKIIGVFLAEMHAKINPEDENILKQYNLQTVYALTNEQEPSENDIKILDLFNRYYYGESQA